jgi:hypothetical protein
MREFSTGEKFWYVVKDTLLSPFSWAIWAVGGVVSYGITSLIPLIFAGLAQCGLIYNNLQNEEYLRKLFVERQEREETYTDQQVESLLEQMDFETRQRIRYILQLQKEISREARADDVESYTRKDLDRMASSLAPIVQRAIRLALRKQQLSKYLQNVDDRALKNYCSNLEQRIAKTDDPVAKAQYEQALRARQTELQTYQAIAQASGRIDSQLENVEATFASWKAKVIRIKTADLASAASASEGLYSELETLSSNIDILDKSVSQALAADEELNTIENRTSSS